MKNSSSKKKFHGRREDLFDRGGGYSDLAPEGWNVYSVRAFVVSRRRLASSFMTPMAILGSVSIAALKFQSGITSALVPDSAETTVADLGCLSIRAISPKNWPRPSFVTSFSPLRTSTDPPVMRWNATADPPSLSMSWPAP